MIRSHKIRIFPNKEQEEYFRKACGIARFTYNWALSEWEKQYKEGLSPNVGKLDKILNKVKRTEFPWMTEVACDIAQRAIKDLGTAYSNFFRSVKNGKPKGYPKFKKKGSCKESFYFTNHTGKIIGKELFVPKLKKPVKCSEELRFSGKIMSYVISLDVNRWYVSIAVETEETLERKENKGLVGIDLGVKNLATLSDGTVFKTRRFYNNTEKRLKRLQRKMSKQKIGGKNRAKTKLKLARQHRKVRLARQDYLHQITTKIAVNYNEVVIENLNVAGMVKNHKLAKAIQNMSFSLFRSMLEYKCEQTECKLTIADRWFPSSKLCSNCGNKKETLKLSERVYRCTACGFEIDRDLNASINLMKLGTCCASKPVDSVEDLSFTGKATEVEAGIDK